MRLRGFRNVACITRRHVFCDCRMRRSIRVQTSKRARSPEPADPPPRPVATPARTMLRRTMTPSRAEMPTPPRTASPPRRASTQRRLSVQRHNGSQNGALGADADRHDGCLGAACREAASLCRGASARRAAFACYAASDRHAASSRLDNLARKCSTVAVPWASAVSVAQ